MPFSPVCVVLCKMYQEDKHGKGRLAMVVALDKAYKSLGKTWQWAAQPKGQWHTSRHYSGRHKYTDTTRCTIGTAIRSYAASIYGCNNGNITIWQPHQHQ